VKYTFRDVAKQLGVSRITVYSKVKNNSKLNEYITEENGLQYLSDEGVNQLSKLIVKLQKTNSKNNNKLTNDELQKKLDTIQESFVKLESKINNDINSKLLINLQVQLEEKDKHINQLTKLLENSQILLKEQQSKTILLESQVQKKSILQWLKFKPF